MKHTMQIFENNEFGKIGIIMIDGKPHFSASKCATILGYSSPRDAIIRYCRYIVKQEVPHPQTENGMTEVSFIPEGDLYRLIINSKLPEADKFEKWVFDEILPAIRKQGAYITEDMLKDMLQNSQLLNAARPQLSEYTNTARMVAGILKSAYVPPEKIAESVAKIYEPLGIPVSLDGVNDKIDDKKTFSASDIAKINGMLSPKGKPHYQAISAIISRLDIGDEHKVIKPYQRGENVIIGYRYDEYVADAVSDWVHENGFPEKIPFAAGSKTYKVRYKYIEDYAKDKVNKK